MRSLFKERGKKLWGRGPIAEMKRDLRKWKEKELPDRGISVSRHGGGLRQIRRERDRLRAAESMSQSIVSGIDVWREKNGMEQEKGKRPPLCWSSC